MPQPSYVTAFIPRGLCMLPPLYASQLHESLYQLMQLLIRLTQVSRAAEMENPSASVWDNYDIKQPQPPGA